MKNNIPQFVLSLDCQHEQTLLIVLNVLLVQVGASIFGFERLLTSLVTSYIMKRQLN